MRALALVAPIPALVAGAVVMRGGDVAPMIWQLNLVGGLVGVLFAGIAMWFAPSPAPGPRVMNSALIVVLLVLGATLLAPGVDGVHRWLPAGPIRIHGAALLAPALLVLLVEVQWRIAVASASVALLVMFGQPDAAQVGAFCAAWIAIVVFRRGRGSTGVVLMALAIASATLLREDPLEPVPYVEGVVGMAASQGMWLSGVAVALVAIVPLALVVLLRPPIGAALGVYVVGTLAATAFGHYPVPYLGYGLSPILGYYGGIAAHALFSHRPGEGESEGLGGPGKGAAQN